MIRVYKCNEFSRKKRSVYFLRFPKATLVVRKIMKCVLWGQRSGSQDFSLGKKDSSKAETKVSAPNALSLRKAG